MSSTPLATHSPENLPVNCLEKRQRDIQESLHCSVCFELICPAEKKLFQCSEGHLICGECKDKNTTKECPTCKLPMRDAIRCRAAENILSLMEVPCAFSGASLTLPYEQRFIFGGGQMAGIQSNLSCVQDAAISAQTIRACSFTRRTVCTKCFHAP